MKILDTNVTINVKDMDLSLSFYESIGFNVKNRWGVHYAQIQAPGITIGLHPSNDPNTILSSGSISIGFTADDFEGAKTMLTTNSIEVVERSEEGGKFLHFKDPDGTSLYFIKPNW